MHTPTPLRWPRAHQPQRADCRHVEHWVWVVHDTGHNWLDVATMRPHAPDWQASGRYIDDMHYTQHTLYPTLTYLLQLHFSVLIYPLCQMFTDFQNLSPADSIIFPSVLWHCWLGDRKGIRPVKHWVLICWWWQYGWSFAHLMAPVVTITSIVLSFNKTV